MSRTLPDRQVASKANFASLALVAENCPADALRMDAPANRIKELRKAKGLTLEQLAERSGYSFPFVQRLEKGRRRLNRDNMRRLASALGCKEEDLVIQRPAGPMRLTPVQVVGAVQAGLWRPSLEWDASESYSVLVTPDLAAHEAFGLEVRGPSMNLKYPDGSIVICIPLLNFWRELENGDDVVCQRQDHDLLESTIKELRFTEAEAWLWPRSDHPEHQAPIRLPWPPNEGDEMRQDPVLIRAVVVASYIVKIRR